MYALLNDSPTNRDKKKKKLIKPIVLISLDLTFLGLLLYFYFFVDDSA